MAIAGPTPLSELHSEDEVRFGAKAVNLGRMAGWGLAVPPGFVIAAQGPVLSSEDRERILRAYQRLGEEQSSGQDAKASGPRVAVRSSAVGEDRSEASFAGQHDSFLDVSGGEALVRAVERCLESRDSERAVAYRHQTGLSECGMGVVVQVMVPAEFAGVCFTRAPYAADQVAVELVPGLGESLVSGRARPAQVRFARADLTACFEDDATGALGRFRVERAREVARVSLEAERQFGFPLDVEWAFAGGVISLLQARPITGACSAREVEQVRRAAIDELSRQAAGRLVVWSDFSIADMLPRPAPLAFDVFTIATREDRGIGAAVRELGASYRPGADSERPMTSICGRSFLNLSAFASAAGRELGLELDARRLLQDDDSAYDPAAAPLRIDWSNPAVLLLPFRLVRLGLVVPVRFFRRRRTFRGEYLNETYPRLVKEAARERNLRLATLSLPDLREKLQSYVDRLTGELIQWHQLSDIFSFATRRWLAIALRMLYRNRAGEVEARLTTALSGNFNTEANLSLADVAAGRLTLDAFLERFGHRGHPDWDVAAARWREDPRHVEQMVAMVTSAEVDPRRQFEAQAARRLEAEIAFDADLRRHWLLRWRRRALLRELSTYQGYSPLRETTQSACYLWVELIRRVLLEAATRTGAGDLLFYLRFDELQHFLAGERADSLLDLARERRHRLQIERRIYVPHVIRSDDLDAIGRSPKIDRSATELRGLGVSSGVARGRARVVEGLGDARDLQPGEILVTSHTDPAWTPLFFVASGLVLEQGGLLSHGAIVAREQGLPAVVNVPHVTRVIETGQEITVLASEGRVLL